ncbi:MAG TPA: hypothetical protein VLH84_00905 [Patescibacteria group bacterium]|nr:hypothetical protein [Patescibacteria group bacterium]
MPKIESTPPSRVDIDYQAVLVGAELPVWELLEELVAGSSVDHPRWPLRLLVNEAAEAARKSDNNYAHSLMTARWISHAIGLLWSARNECEVASRVRERAIRLGERPLPPDPETDPAFELGHHPLLQETLAGLLVATEVRWHDEATTGHIFSEYERDGRTDFDNYTTPVPAAVSCCG